MSDGEPLDVLDAHGAPTGVTKPRREVHRDGDWHAAFHLWVVGAAGVLLQRRAAAKTSWAGFLDATAAGHLLAGESVADGLREVREELGVTYAFGALTSLGVHRVQEPRPGGGFNREHQHVYAVRDERPLRGWTDFDRVELDGLVLIAHDAFSGLVGPARAPASARAFDGVMERAITVAAAELVPAPYLPRVARALGAIGTGA